MKRIDIFVQFIRFPGSYYGQRVLEFAKNHWRFLFTRRCPFLVSYYVLCGVTSLTSSQLSSLLGALSNG